MTCTDFEKTMNTSNQTPNIDSEIDDPQSDHISQSDNEDDEISFNSTFIEHVQDFDNTDTN